METRKCKVCGEVKPITDYYKHGGYYDTKCKECAKEYTRQYVNNHREERLAYSKAYYQSHKEESLAYSRQWCEDHPEKVKKYSKKSYEKNAEKRKDYQRKYRGDRPEIARAQSIINMRIKRGKLTKPTVCEVCGKEGRVEAHHADYSKPLEVIWCCKSCHYKLDHERRDREEKRA